MQLAFPTVLQLSARQRAVLLPRDVLGFSRPEAAGILQITATRRSTVPCIAHGATMDERRAVGRIRDVGRSPVSEVKRVLVEGFIEAWHAGDVPSFLSTVPAGGNLTEICLARTRANGQPAVAAYSATGSLLVATGSWC